MKIQKLKALGIFLLFFFMMASCEVDNEDSFTSPEDSQIELDSRKKSCESLNILSSYNMFTAYYGNALQDKFNFILTDENEIQEAISELALPINQRSKIIAGTINPGRNYNSAPWNFHLTDCTLNDFTIEICDAHIDAIQTLGCKTLDDHCECRWTPWLSKLRSGPHIASSSKIIDFDITLCPQGTYTAEWTVGGEKNISHYILQTRPQAGVEWRNLNSYKASNAYPDKVIEYKRKAPPIHPCFQARIVAVDQQKNEILTSPIIIAICN